MCARASIAAHMCWLRIWATASAGTSTATVSPRIIRSPTDVMCLTSWSTVDRMVHSQRGGEPVTPTPPATVVTMA